MTSVQERVRAAGADLVAFIKSDAPAAGLEEFVSKYFPLLRAHPVGDDLLVENNRQQRTYVRRDAQQAHGGWVGLTGSHKFRTSEIPQRCSNCSTWAAVPSETRRASSTNSPFSAIQTTDRGNARNQKPHRPDRGQAHPQRPHPHREQRR